MGCHKAIAQAIRDKRAGYRLQLKDNHPKVRDEVVSYFASEIGDSLLATDEIYLLTVMGLRGRHERQRRQRLGGCRSFAGGPPPLASLKRCLL